MGKITILEQWTMKNPLECIGYFAGTCYGSDVTNKEKNVKRAKVNSEHGRLLELPDVYMVIDDYSAKAIRELYTHIGGAPTRLQASTRYIDYSDDKNFKNVLPITVRTDKEKESWNRAINTIKESMNELKEAEVPKEDYTNLLPLAYDTKMVWKVNLRCLINFMNQRLCTRAYWEIRGLAKDIKEALSNYSDEWKYLCDNMFVPKCEMYGYCTEAKGCGKKANKRVILAEAKAYEELVKKGLAEKIS